MICFNEAATKIKIFLTFKIMDAHEKKRERDRDDSLTNNLARNLKGLVRKFLIFHLFFFPAFLYFLLFSTTQAHAAILNFTGWETGDNTEAVATSGTFSVQSTTVRTGGYALRTNPSTTAAGRHLFTNIATNGASGTGFNVDNLYTTFYFRYATLPSSNDEPIFQAVGSSGGLKLELRINSSGNLAAYDTTPSLLTTGTTALSANTWYRLDVLVGTGATASWEVQINGTSEISGTGNLNTQQNGDVRLGKAINRNGNTIDFFYDDAVFNDSAYTTTPQVVRMDPDGTGNYAAWTGDNTDVDEIPHDSDTTYITSSTMADEETETLESSSAAGVVGTIAATKSIAIVRDEGAASAIQVRLRSGSTDNDTTSNDPGATYILRAKVYTTDPADSAAWTSGDLDALEVGVENISTGALRVTMLSVMVVSSGNANPDAPSSLGPSTLIDGSFGTDNTPTLTFTLSDSDTSDTVRYQIQIDDSSDFSSAVVDHTSALAAQGSASFTVGQAAGSGTYTTGSEGQTLSDGSYYWRVLATDNGGLSSSYSTANSGAIAFKVDATPPILVDLDAPGDNSYISSERPTFRFKATTDATVGLSKYVLEIDNGDQGDFTINDIPPSRTTDYEVSRYLLHYDGFSDSDSTNNYISVYTKSSSDWSLDLNSGQNEGRLKEGKRGWKVKAVDSAGNESANSRTLFVDRTSPRVKFTQMNSTPLSSNNFSTTDKTPTLFGRITDSLSSGDSSTASQNENGPKIASGPKEVEIKIEKQEGLTYKLYTLDAMGINNPWYTCDDSQLADNSKNKCDKYLPFEYTLDGNLDLGTYKITLIGKDKAGNTSSPTSFTLKITTLSQITTPEEKKVIEEEIKELSEEEQKKIKEELEITKPTAPEASPQPVTVQKKGKDFFQIGKEIAETIGDKIKFAFNAIGESYSKDILLGIRSVTDQLVDKMREGLAQVPLAIVRLGYFFTSELTRIYDVKVIVLSPTSAKISWKTNHPATGKVNYGFDDGDYSFEEQTAKRTTYHEFNLTNLKPNTEYHYEVMSQNKNYVYDASRRFKTPPEESNK